MLLELFDGIFANTASATRVKTAIVEIQREEIISKEEKEEELMRDNIDQQKNFNRDISPIDWLDSLPASLRVAIYDSTSINILNKDGLDSQQKFLLLL